MVNTQIGVLALQGGFDPHLRMLAQLGYPARKVRDPQDLEGLAGLVLPGGESTTLGKLMQRFGILEAIRRHHTRGMAILGTCAGLILLARDIRGSDQIRLGLLDIEVERNAYGPQVESFEASVRWWDGSETPAVFIRAPIVRRTGDKVEVLAEREARPVLIRQGRILGSTYHPELTEDTRVHRLFLEFCGVNGAAPGAPGN